MIKKITFLLTGFILLSMIACTQTATPSKIVTAKIKILNLLPVGWGVKYQGLVLEIIEGDARILGDTIRFGIIESKSYEDVNKGDIRIITFENSGKRNEKPYLPAISGTVSQQHEIWLIRSIKKPM